MVTRFEIDETFGRVELVEPGLVGNAVVVTTNDVLRYACGEQAGIILMAVDRAQVGHRGSDRRWRLEIEAGRTLGAGRCYRCYMCARSSLLAEVLPVAERVARHSSGEARMWHPSKILLVVILLFALASPAYANSAAPTAHSWHDSFFELLPLILYLALPASIFAAVLE